MFGLPMLVPKFVERNPANYTLDACGILMRLSLPQLCIA
jgi:hypothetical protein